MSLLFVILSINDDGRSRDHATIDTECMVAGAPRLVVDPRPSSTWDRTTGASTKADYLACYTCWDLSPLTIEGLRHLRYDRQTSSGLGFMQYDLCSAQEA
mgnify:FL=1